MLLCLDVYFCFASTLDASFYWKTGAGFVLSNCTEIADSLPYGLVAKASLSVSVETSLGSIFVEPFLIVTIQEPECLMPLRTNVKSTRKSTRFENLKHQARNVKRSL